MAMDAERVSRTERARSAATEKASANPAPEHWSELPLLLVPDEVAHLLRTTRKAVYAMTERGELPGIVRPGRRRRLLFDRDALLHWLRESRAASSGGSRR
jgi:excisionase family DNA binding protein